MRILRRFLPDSGARAVSLSPDHGMEVRDVLPMEGEEYECVFFFYLLVVVGS